MCDKFDDPDDQRLLAILYTVHELIHEGQGIAEKADVTSVRFAGAESALMHMDLGADHHAAELVHQTIPGSTLEHIKDLQGRSVQAFPVTRSHPQFARVRKILRLVGLRTDLIMRRLGLFPAGLPNTAYAFADFSPGGGAFVAMVNEPLFRVIKLADASQAQASKLFSSVEDLDLAEVDRVLEDLLS